jgi:hypothetical protein
VTSPFAREDGAGFDAAELFEVARQVGHGGALGMEFRASGTGRSLLSLGASSWSAFP